MKRILKYILILAVLIIVGYFGLAIMSPKEDIMVSLKWKHQAQFAGMYVADDKGYYSKEGLDVNLKEFEFDSNHVDDLENGISDFILLSAEEFVTFVDDGKDIVAVAAFYQTSPYVMVSLSGSGIKTPADFVNKRLGVKGGKLEEKLFYLLLLNKFGISEDLVDIRELGFAKKEVEDLLDGDVDVIGLYRTDQLYYFNQRNVDYNVINPELFGININNDVLVTRRDLVEGNPELVRKFVQSSVKGWETALDNPEKAVDITMKYVIDDNYKDRDYEMFILNSSIPLIQQGTSQEIGHVSSSDFDKLYEFMDSYGFLTTEFNISDFYTNDFVE